MRKTRSALAAVAGTALLFSACSAVDSNDAEASAGPGVTDDTITLGYLTDLSGPASGAGKVDYQGSKLYIDKLNEDGGLCGRQVELSVQDHGYDPQKALTLYQQTEPDVLGYLSTLGTPVLASLGSKLKSDQILTTTLGWDYVGLQNTSFIVAPSTSDMDMVAGLGYLAEEGVLHEGDSVGAVYIQGLGVSQEPGVDYAADQLGLDVVPFEIAPTVTDLSSQIAQFKKAGVKAIVAAGLSTQTAAIATGAEAAGLDVPIVTGTAGFVAGLMSTGAAPALEKNLYVVLGWSPLSADSPAVAEVRAAWKSDKGGTEAETGLVTGWAMAKIYTDIIAKSCDDLTREGVIAAYRSISELPMDGLMPDLDFSKPGEQPARGYNITRPEAGVEGGLKLVSDPFVTPAIVEDYESPSS